MHDAYSVSQQSPFSAPDPAQPAHRLWWPGPQFPPAWDSSLSWPVVLWAVLQFGFCDVLNGHMVSHPSGDGLRGLDSQQTRSATAPSLLGSLPRCRGNGTPQHTASNRFQGCSVITQYLCRLQTGYQSGVGPWWPVAACKICSQQLSDVRTVLSPLVTMLHITSQDCFMTGSLHPLTPHPFPPPVPTPGDHRSVLYP